MLRSAFILAALLAAGPAAAVCPGDCDGDGAVRINELVIAVGIALGQAPAGDCTAVDGNGDGQVGIAELVAATNALLGGCPATPTPTAPPAESPTPTSTATANQPPSLAAPFVYRGFAGEPIARPLGASDPDGGEVSCAADALLAGMSLGPDYVLRWTPTADQVGLVDVPVRCQDTAEPPLTTDGNLAFRIAPRDSCATPVCDPASGCTETLPEVIDACCDGREVPRIPEAEVICPQGRVLQVGRNADGFGPLQHCDRLRFRRSAQTSASLRFHVRVSCLNALNRITVKARLVSSTLGVVIDEKQAEARVFFAPSESAEGFSERRNIDIPFTKSGPYLQLEEQEADLIVTATDSDGVTVSRTLRVFTTSDALLPDLPDP